MKTDTTLRLTRTQYRVFAEQIKQAGCCLSLSTFRELGNAWGMFNPMAQSVLVDTTEAFSAFTESRIIQLATSIRTNDVRNCQRPEIDWAELEDHEIYPFVVAHELGHLMDNFEIWNIWRIEDLDVQLRCQTALRSINEVLADRYGWEQIRPGEPVPLSEHGKSAEEKVAADLALLNMHAPRIRRGSPRIRPAGQYTHVPRDMLLSAQMIAYVGPAVSGELIGRVQARSRVYRRDSRSRTSQ
ncbi:hypothetical protein [Pseudomonas sp. DWP3-1-2]|uniref:hypothetical protein n=1 Tax=Pseudomonas sp. DWP3-1-2 TaxID=2804645 RepID=UPI003CF34329